MKGLRIVLITFLVIGCASAGNQRPLEIAQPDLSVRLVNPLFFGSGTTAPATLEVTIANRANASITLRRLEVDSPGMAEYSLFPYTRNFNETIGPGETKTFTLFATARTGIARLTPNEPLTLRVFADFMAGKTRFRDIYLNLRG